ncbi:MAG: methyltransferase domain-containing protein [Acidimicrobiia bacterium]
MTDHHRTPLGLVVPVFDEAVRLADYGKRLIDFVDGLPAGSELVFVDDGSTDDTPERIDELIAAAPGAPARLLRRRHAGKGAAVSAGLRSLRAPLRGFCDLDLSTPLDDLERIADAAVRARALAIGSRELATSRLVQPEGSVRMLLGRTYNRTLQALVTPGVVDTQCGAKVAPREVWDAVLPHCREEGFAWDAEVVAVAQALGLAMVEVPVNWRHDERSKVKVGRDGFAMVLAIPRIRRSARRAAEEQRARASTGTDGAPRPGTDARAGGVAAAVDVAGAAEVFDVGRAELRPGSDDSDWSFRNNWWFRSTAALVATALRRTATPRPERGWLIDLGGGSGGVTAMLGWPPDRAAVLDRSPDLVARARRLRGFDAVRASVHQVPLAGGAAEVVCLLDVIEHLEDPRRALDEAARVLAPDGRLVVTVPAHRWLGGAAGERLGHVRRYTRRSLRAELATAGFAPVVLTHVFSWLVPAAWLRRRLVATGDAAPRLDRTSRVLDALAMGLTRAERSVLGRIGLPFGTSVLCIARLDRHGG